jgi:Homeodomain-like domain-containing protein
MRSPAPIPAWGWASHVAGGQDQDQMQRQQRVNGSSEEASVPQQPAHDLVRARVWELHLRGVPKRRIAEAVGINRETVSRWLAAELGPVQREGKRERERQLAEAIARLRRTQEQAWNDHDADDARERAFIEAAKAQPGARYQSQRAQYLRVIVDAEKEIARLLGLYDVAVMAAVAGVSSDGSGAGAGAGAAVVFRIERVSSAGAE